MDAIYYKQLIIRPVVAVVKSVASIVQIVFPGLPVAAPTMAKAGMVTGRPGQYRTIAKPFPFADKYAL